jgi:hypothetical protein
MTDRKTCLDLFSGVGGFSAAFRESPDWDVTRVEIDPTREAEIHADVLDLRPADLPQDPDVILASPPCTVFSPANAQENFIDREPVTDRAKEHVALALHTYALIQALSPTWYYVENPRGKLRWFWPERPRGTVTYCRYGRAYMKPTDLYGRHPPGMSYRSCNAGDPCHTRNVADDGTPATASMPDDYGERAKVPYKLSEAVRTAVEGAETTQQSLTSYQ